MILAAINFNNGINGLTDFLNIAFLSTNERGIDNDQEFFLSYQIYLNQALRKNLDFMI